MTLQEELLEQDYNVGIYAPEFDGDVRGQLSFHKEIDSENYLINFSIDVLFTFESHEFCEVDEIELTELKVIDDDSNEVEIPNELYKLIESKIDVYYE